MPKILIKGYLGGGSPKQRFRVVGINGIAPCLTATDWKDPIKIEVERHE